MVVAANEVKKRGVSLFRELFKKFDEIIISNRGKKEFVVIGYEIYKKFREYELERAYEEVMEDVKEGRVVSQTSQSFKISNPNSTLLINRPITVS